MLKAHPSPSPVPQLYPVRAERMVPGVGDAPPPSSLRRFSEVSARAMTMEVGDWFEWVNPPERYLARALRWRHRTGKNIRAYKGEDGRVIVKRMAK